VEIVESRKTIGTQTRFDLVDLLISVRWLRERSGRSLSGANAQISNDHTHTTASSLPKSNLIQTVAALFVSLIHLSWFLRLKQTVRNFDVFCILIPQLQLSILKHFIIMSSKRSDSDNEEEEEVVNHQFKIILLGDGAVGKTSIATRFSDDKFSQNYKQTVGVDFFIKRISLPR
jgi:hypothetical protein